MQSASIHYTAVAQRAAVGQFFASKYYLLAVQLDPRIVFLDVLFHQRKQLCAININANQFLAVMKKEMHRDRSLVLSTESSSTGAAGGVGDAAAAVPEITGGRVTFLLCASSWAATYARSVFTAAFRVIFLTALEETIL